LEAKARIATQQPFFSNSVRAPDGATLVASGWRLSGLHSGRTRPERDV